MADNLLLIKEAIPVILDFMDINIKRNQLLKDRARILRLNMTKPEKKVMARSSIKKTTFRHKVY